VVQSGLPAAANGIVAAVWQNTLPGAWCTGDGPLPASTGRKSFTFSEGPSHRARPDHHAGEFECNRQSKGPSPSAARRTAQRGRMKPML
jgi:hypothetical protein